MTDLRTGRNPSRAPVEGTRIEAIDLARLLKPLIERMRKAEQIALLAASLRKYAQRTEFVVMARPDSNMCDSSLHLVPTHSEYLP